MDHHAKINWDLATETNTASSSSSQSNTTTPNEPAMASANDPLSECQRTRVLERNRAAGNA